MRICDETLGLTSTVRILFLSHYFPPEGNAPATRIHALCKRWVKAGHDVRVITGAPNVPDGVVYPGYKNRLCQQEVIDGIRVVRVWTYLAANKGTARRTANYLSFMVSAALAGFFVGKADVLLATSPQFFNGWAGVLLSKLRRLPFILEIRDIWPESIQAVGAIRQRRPLRFLESLERRMYAAADHIVTVGEGYCDQLVARGVPRPKVSIITNGADLESYFPREPDWRIRRQYGLEGRFVCAYVGTIGMAHGLDTVLKAASLLKSQGHGNVQFLLVGDGASRGQLEESARLQGLSNVTFTGRQPKELIPSILAAADVCLVHLRKTPLFESVLPSKIFECAAMAKPIILGVRGQAAKMVADAGAGLCIEPEDAEQLAGTVQRLRDNPHLCATLGQAGYKWVTKQFNRDNLAEAYLQIIQDVLREVNGALQRNGDMLVRPGLGN